jgi:hypothetical protein
MERGDLDEMSFAFRVVRQDWAPDWSQRDIREVDLNKGDVSVVNYGANPHTAGLTSLRSAELANVVRELTEGRPLTEDRLNALRMAIPGLIARSTLYPVGEPATVEDVDLSLFDARLRALDI